MSVARAFTVSLVGLSASVVEVEADIASGLPGFVLTGCADATLREARERVRAAATNTGTGWPARRITVGLSPAAVPKRGGSLDVAIATAVLAAAEVVPVERLEGTVLLGELGLDGAVRSVSGVLPAVLGASREGIRRFVVPVANAVEAALVAGEVIAVRSLREVLVWLTSGETPAVASAETSSGLPAAPIRHADLADVIGQPRAVRALEIAAAGGHHLLLSGPPGIGKTMLAERLPGLLPDLTSDEALEVTAIHSVAGVLPAGSGLVTRPPYCAPHHTSSTAALIGGGSRLASPGAASLAHRGVLFLDEAPEFGPRNLDALRQPLEGGEIVIGRAGGVTRYPARFLLALAANPCGCGVDGEPTDASLAPDCQCTSVQRRRYRSRLSGPLLDRVDIRLTLAQPDRGLADAGQRAPHSQEVRDRVCAARERARVRLHGSPWMTTGDVPGPTMRRRWPVGADGGRMLDSALSAGQISARGVDRVLKLSWTIADLAGRGVPCTDDVAEALALRRHGAATGGIRFGLQRPA